MQHRSTTAIGTDQRKKKNFFFSFNFIFKHKVSKNTPVVDPEKTKKQFFSKFHAVSPNKDKKNNKKDII